MADDEGWLKRGKEAQKTLESLLTEGYGALQAR